MSKITIDIPDHVYETIAEHLANFDDVYVSVEELKGNQHVTDWIEIDSANGTGWNDFEDGLENLDLADELGLA